jgi:hypothetical protein
MAQHQTVLGDQSMEVLVHPEQAAPEDLLREQTAGLQMVLKACLQRELMVDSQETMVAQQVELTVDLQRELGMAWQMELTVAPQMARHLEVLTGK